MDGYIHNLKTSIRTGKLGQAKALLAGMSSRPEPEKKEAFEILALTSGKAAFELLSDLAPETRQDPDMHERLVRLITDRAHLDFRFALILLNLVDRNTAFNLSPLLRHILTNGTDKDLLNAIIRAAGKLHMESMIDDIAEFIFYDDPILKTEAVRALERIGTPKACEKLEQASKTRKSDQDILDALDVLKSKEPVATATAPSPAHTPDSLENDLDRLSSVDVNERFKAFITLSEKGAELSPILLKHLKKDPDHDLMINILRLISRTIPLEAVNDLFDLIARKETAPAVRFTAYTALEAFPELESAASVIQGISDPSLPVRLAAMKVLDKNLSDFVCAEIKNRIESGTKKGEALAETVLDARAGHIIEYLMVSDTFSYMASNYLTRTAPVQVLDTFIQILESRNLKSTAKKYLDIREKRAARDTDRVIVISSYESILNAYCRILYTSGLSSLTFRRPQDAFEAMVSQKPAAVICDLFLNDMTGMTLAGEVRGLYSTEDVPVIISALQKNLDKPLLQAELDRAGVNALWEFPPKPAQIKSWIK
ncbi:MAG: HEAT repeat domain-containing protein [Desulfobacteraceae bacterium]|nr:HEAT repeat domain-containing protein [Desulfobacteraceae bacterium]